MGIKLVIVDDAPFIREVIKNILLHSDSNIEVVGEATNGQEAKEVVEIARPDVVLMDMVMPIKSGIEATKEILKLFPNIKVIACTMMDQEVITLKALDAGCCSFVTKPFQANDLIKAITSSYQKKEAS